MLCTLKPTYLFPSGKMLSIFIVVAFFFLSLRLSRSTLFSVWYTMAHLSQRFITETFLVLWSACIHKSLGRIFFSVIRTLWLHDIHALLRGVGSFVKQVHRLKQEISALIPEFILSLKGYDDEACAGGFILTFCTF